MGSKIKSIREIVKFYQSHARYQQNTREELYYHIEPSFAHNQYQIFRDQEIYGFCNWAYVDQETENNFLHTGIIDDWNCGSIMLHIDFVATRNIRKIMSWLKNNAVETLGLGQTIHWARLDNNNSIRKIMKQNTKASWSWAE